MSKRARSTAPPGPQSGAGRVRRPGGMPRTTTGPPLLVGVKKAAKHNRRGTQKQQKETTKTLLPPRVQKRASEGASVLKPRKFQENPQNARGPEWHPEKTPRSGTHGQKGRTRQVRRDKKGTGKSNPSACGGVPCYYLSFLSKKHKIKKRDVGEKNPKEERKKNPETQDLTSREFFETFSGARNQIIMQKHRQNSTNNDTTNTDTDTIKQKRKTKKKKGNLNKKQLVIRGRRINMRTRKKKKNGKTNKKTKRRIRRIRRIKRIRRRERRRTMKSEYNKEDES